MRSLRAPAFALLQDLAALVAVICCLFVRKERRQLIWGVTPIINNTYWSRAMAQAGWESRTLVHSYYASINRREDFDLYYETLSRHLPLPAKLRHVIEPGLAMYYIVRHAAVVHLPFSGGPLGHTRLWRLEAHLLRLCGIKTVLLPYGSDAYMYSRVIDPLLRHGLLLSYPNAARDEETIERRVRHWVRHADVVIAWSMVDGIGRWDVTTNCPFCVDVEQWRARERYSPHDGVSGPVRVLHTPNHRGFKGTEFLARAVEELRAEGLQVELVLLERVPNEQVRAVMQTVDILAEQFIASSYAMSGVEGMASGLPVMANLEHEAYTRLFRRYGFLDECPIVSTSPETLKRNLRALVTHPELREELGRAGRRYAEKYHSYATAQYMFGAIYDRLLRGKDVDLINLFHPLKAAYVRRDPVRHPLEESRLPARYLGEGRPAQA